MKRWLTIFAFASLSLLGCGNNFTTSGFTLTALSGTVDTVDINYINISGADLRSAYFSFASNKLTYLPANTWDLSIARVGKRVVANCGNYGMGVRLYKTSQTDISADYSSLKDSVHHIIDTKGPFTNVFDSAGIGSDTVYLIKDALGKYYKVQFEKFDSTGSYLLHVAQGLVDTAASLSGSLQSNIPSAYFDLNIDSEVSAKLPADWDIRFARGVEFTEGPLGIGARSAVMLNTDAHVQAGFIAGKKFDEVTSVAGVSFSGDVDAIGANWYTYNSSANPPYSVNPGVWIVKTQDGKFWKLALLTFYGPQGEEFYTVFQFAEIS